MDRTWLAVANSYLDQNLVDLAQLLCAMMPYSKGKEHYLAELLHTVELKCLHFKTAKTIIIIESWSSTSRSTMSCRNIQESQCYLIADSET
jgi:hypothetical protein